MVFFYRISYFVRKKNDPIRNCNCKSPLFCIGGGTTVMSVARGQLILQKQLSENDSSSFSADPLSPSPRMLAGTPDLFCMLIRSYSLLMKYFQCFFFFFLNII